MQAGIIKPTLAAYTTFFLLFLYAPFVVLTILSFQTGPDGGPQFPIVEWSTYWYRHLVGLTPPSRVAPLPISESLVRSLTLAFMTMVVSTIIATLQDRVVSWLYYADRLFQLPLGVIGVAIGVVLLPTLSHKLRSGDHAAAATCFTLQSELLHLQSRGVGGSGDRARYERAWREQSNVIARAEALVLCFPTWWYGMPNPSTSA